MWPGFGCSFDSDDGGWVDHKEQELFPVTGKKDSMQNLNSALYLEEAITNWFNSALKIKKADDFVLQ